MAACKSKVAWGELRFRRLLLVVRASDRLPAGRSWSGGESGSVNHKSIGCVTTNGEVNTAEAVCVEIVVGMVWKSFFAENNRIRSPCFSRSHHTEMIVKRVPASAPTHWVPKEYTPLYLHCRLAMTPRKQGNDHFYKWCDVASLAPSSICKAAWFFFNDCHRAAEIQPLFTRVLQVLGLSHSSVLSGSSS